MAIRDTHSEYVVVESCPFITLCRLTLLLILQRVLELLTHGEMMVS